MIHDELLAALRDAGGRATLGDLIARTALPAPAIREAILPALSRVGGHVAVDEHGELIYAIDRRRHAPPETTRLRRALNALVALARAIFTTGLIVVLIAYFILYVLIIVALAVVALAAAAKGGDADCDCNCDCGKADCAGCGDPCAGMNCNGCGDTCFACFTCGSERKKAARRELRASQRQDRVKRRARREARREARSERRRDAIKRLRARVGLSPSPAHLGFGLETEDPPDNPPLSRAVHAFVFGPPRPAPDPRARERNLLAFAQAHDGRVTASDAVALTGLSLADADAVLLDLAARFEGDVHVTDAGVIVFTFDRLLVSATEQTDVLAWIAEQGHAVTVEAFARRQNIAAAEARARLSHLAALVGGRAEHGETSVFVFPPDAATQMNALAARADALRDYTFAWERLELAPRVLGVPAGKRGWVIGFNTLNLALALAASVVYADGGSILDVIEGGWSPAWEPLVLGYLPLFFSASVFLIPLVRAIAVSVTNGERRVRNARRVVLLGLFHALEEDDAKVSAAELKQVLHLERTQENRAQLTAALERLTRELEGSVDHEAGVDDDGGYTYVFPRVFEELHAIEHERLAVDLDALALTEVAYDTAAPM